jgi:chromosome partitioning protein
MPRDYKVWMIATLKGGVGKTKSAMFLAQELANRGEHVMIADADPGTQGVTDWVTRLLRDYPHYDMPWDVQQWSPKYGGLLVQWLDQAVRQTGARRVVLDLGAEMADVVATAAILADQIVIPVGTHQDELARLEPTWRAVKPNARAGICGVLLTRVDAVGKGAASDVRRVLAHDAYHTYETEIPRSRAAYDRFGLPIEQTGAYAALTDELLKREEY